MTKNYISYSTFKDTQFLNTGSRGKRKLRWFYCYFLLLLVILMVTIYIIYLRLTFRSDKPPWPPNRKMGGVLTYEFGYLVWDPLPTNTTSQEVTNNGAQRG